MVHRTNQQVAGLTIGRHLGLQGELSICFAGRLEEDARLYDSAHDNHTSVFLCLPQTFTGRLPYKIKVSYACSPCARYCNVTPSKTTTATYFLDSIMTDMRLEVKTDWGGAHMDEGPPPSVLRPLSPSLRVLFDTRSKLLS